MFSFKISGFLFAMFLFLMVMPAFDYVDPPPDKEASLKAFKTILKVLKSPRCMNCHPSDNQPRQGEDELPHLFDVVRGENDEGGLIQKCSTCHNDKNNDYSNVPGAPNWKLAPLSMGWMGLSDFQIGLALMDRSKNGNKSPEDLVKHMSEDKLVLWAWNPGAERIPPAVPLNEFRQNLVIWLENGSEVPSE